MHSRRLWRSRHANRATAPRRTDRLAIVVDTLDHVVTPLAPGVSGLERWSTVSTFLSALADALGARVTCYAPIGDAGRWRGRIRVNRSTRARSARSRRSPATGRPRATARPSASACPGWGSSTWLRCAGPPATPTARCSSSARPPTTPTAPRPPRRWNWPPRWSPRCSAPPSSRPPASRWSTGPPGQHGPAHRVRDHRRPTQRDQRSSRPPRRRHRAAQPHRTHRVLGGPVRTGRPCRRRALPRHPHRSRRRGDPRREVERLRELIAEPVTVDGIAISRSASIGVAMDLDRTLQPDALLWSAVRAGAVAARRSR